MQTITRSLTMVLVALVLMTFNAEAARKCPTDNVGTGCGMLKSLQHKASYDFAAGYVTGVAQLLYNQEMVKWPEDVTGNDIAKAIVSYLERKPGRQEEYSINIIREVMDKVYGKHEKKMIIMSQEKYKESLSNYIAMKKFLEDLPE